MRTAGGFVGLGQLDGDGVGCGDGTAGPVDPVFDLLSRHHATYVVMSGAGLPCVLRATSTTVYVRLHGPDHDHLYAGSYGDADLYWWADRIREWHPQHLRVFAYFNNDGYGHAVTNAGRLRTLTNS
jgi:uncharacterized protein YecE (DUF72 family)